MAHRRTGDRDQQLLVPFAAAVPLFVAMALVPLRGHLASEVIALVLSLTVVVGGLLAGRIGGAAAALMAAASFDFFFTQPYLSLKVANGNDLATTLVLLVVGLVVGVSSDWGRRRPIAGQDSAALLRVLHVAAEGCAEDVEISVRAELLGLLGLRDCSFTPGPTSLTLLDASGRVRISETSSVAGDLVLPAEGIAIPVMWGDDLFGYIEASPISSRVVSARDRRIAVAIVQTLALAMAAEPSQA